MYQLKSKEIEQAQMFGVVHPYLRSGEWWIIISSNDVLPIFELRLDENCPGLVVDQDIKSWEEAYGGSGKFGVFVSVIKHDKCTFDQIMKTVGGGDLVDGKDVLVCVSPEHHEYVDDLMEFAKKLSDFMNESDKMT